ncbi:MAG: hypothetical protein HRT38_19435 [Alteromonadaceae bacterium]|nr:hypothetical protein [Alteromonadaceae bacterium]
MAPSKAIFFALAEQRKRESAGSGFAEWGKHYAVGTDAGKAVNEGLWCRQRAGFENTLAIGRWDANATGVSRVNNPIVNVNGVAHIIRELGGNAGDHSSNYVNFPPAPDGLDKNDGTRYADLAAAIIDGGTSLSSSVLSRQDFVFLEVWHEKISDKDAFFPLGNVQYSGTMWEGIPTLYVTDNDGIDTLQGYSAYGDWDTNTLGRGMKFSTLSDDEKALAIQAPENNIYSDNG